MESLGHSTITVTMNTYERVLPAIMNCVLNTLMSPQMTLHLLAVMQSRSSSFPFVRYSAAFSPFLLSLRPAGS